MKRSRTGSSAGKAPAISSVATVQVPLPLLAVLADAKTAFFGLCLTAGQQVFHHPSVQGRDYILHKLNVFHQEHQTPIPEQLRDPGSFAARLRAMLAARREYRVAEGELLAVPEPKSAGLCVLVLKLPDYPLAVTVLNFGREEAEEDLAGVVKAAGDVPRGDWVDVLTGKPVERSPVRVPALTGTTFVLRTAR